MQYDITFVLDPKTDPHLDPDPDSEKSLHPAFCGGACLDLDTASVCFSLV